MQRRIMLFFCMERDPQRVLLWGLLGDGHKKVRKTARLACHCRSFS